MQKHENPVMTEDQELVDILLDFIIAAANLAKGINRTMKQRQTVEGGKSHEQNERTGTGNQRPAKCRRHH